MEFGDNWPRVRSDARDASSSRGCSGPKIGPLRGRDSISEVLEVLVSSIVASSISIVSKGHVFLRKLHPHLFPTSSLFLQ